VNRVERSLADSDCVFRRRQKASIGAGIELPTGNS
jgi:hypothetical protein